MHNKRCDFLIWEDIKQGEVMGATDDRLHLKRTAFSKDSPDSNSGKSCERGCRGEPVECGFGETER